MSKFRDVILVNQILKSYKTIKENADFFFRGASVWCCPVVHCDRLDLPQKCMPLVFALHKNRKYKSTSVNNQHSLRLKIPA